MARRVQARPGLSSHTITALLVFAIMAVLGTGLVMAQIEGKSGDTVIFSGTLGDMGFVAGGEVTLSAVSDDDLFVAGGDVTIDGAGADHLMAAGGDVSFRGIDVRDVIAAGGNLIFSSGTIADDLVGFGGNISIGSDVDLGGSAVLSGGNITLASDIGGSLHASGGNVTLDGDVGEDAFLAGGAVVIGPDVVIGGNLTYQAESFTMDPSATVSGDIIEEEYEGGSAEFGIAAVFGFMLSILVFLIGFGLLILAIVAVFPGLMNRSSEMIETSPFKALGFGFLALIVAPALALVLMVTIVGMPAGFAVLSLVFVLTLFAFAAFTYFSGMKLRGLFGHTDEPYIVARIVWTLLAGIILLAVGIIPIVGMIVWLAALLLGMGAVVTHGGAALAEG